MNTYAERRQINNGQSVANIATRIQGGKPGSHFIDNRSVAIAQRKLQGMANNRRTAIESNRNVSSKDVLQLMSPEELLAFGKDQAEFMAKIKPPTSGMNVWSV